MWKALLRAGESGAALPGAAADARPRDLRARSGAGKPWRTTNGRSAGAPPPGSRVKRDFTATAPNRLWVADLHVSALLGGRRVLRFVIDVFSRKVVGWQLASHMRTDLVLDALRMALGDPGPRAPTSRCAPLRCRLAIHVASTTPRSLDDHDVLASIGIGRRRLRQRAGRELRRQLQDRADRRPRLANPRPSSSSRSSATSAGSTTSGCTPRSATSRPPSSKRSTSSATRPRPTKFKTTHDH